MTGDITTAETTLRVEADLEAVRALGPWLRQRADELCCPAGIVDRLGEIELALHELAVNIVEHALDGVETEQRFWVALDASPQTLVATFVDRGRPYQHVELDPMPAEPRVGGYGMIIVEQLAQSLDYVRAGDENRWTVVFDSAAAV